MDTSKLQAKCTSFLACQEGKVLDTKLSHLPKRLAEALFATKCPPDVGANPGNVLINYVGPSDQEGSPTDMIIGSAELRSGNYLVTMTGTMLLACIVLFLLVVSECDSSQAYELAMHDVID